MPYEARLFRYNIILIVLCLPVLVYAECAVTLECGGGYGRRSMNFPDRPSCEAKLSETQSWLESVGGGCDITDACSSCEEASEPDYVPYVPPTYDYEAQRRRQEEQRRKEEEEAQQRQEEFERNKAETVKSLKGANASAGLELKGDTSSSLQLKGTGGAGPNPCPGALTCFTYFCGGTSSRPYVCVPKGFPYLNHCDCKSYNSSNFECKSYSYCQEK